MDLEFLIINKDIKREDILQQIIYQNCYKSRNIEDFKMLVNYNYVNNYNCVNFKKFINNPINNKIPKSIKKLKQLKRSRIQLNNSFKEILVQAADKEKKDIENLKRNTLKNTHNLSKLKKFCEKYIYRPYWIHVENDLAHLYIQFEEVTLTNQYQEKITIYDLFVELTINIKDNYFLSDIYGAKATWSYEEYRCGYIHSHLPSRNSSTFQKFCLGSSPFSRLMHSRALISEELFITILYNLEEYLQWESVEGGPYIYMKNVLNSKVEAQLSRPDSLNHSICKKLMEVFSFDNAMLKNNGGKVVLEINSDSYDERHFLAQELIKIDPSYKEENIFCYLNSKGEEINIRYSLMEDDDDEDYVNCEKDFEKIIKNRDVNFYDVRIPCKSVKITEENQQSDETLLLRKDVYRLFCNYITEVFYQNYHKINYEKQEEIKKAVSEKA